MAAPKGNKYSPGRPKGSQNKETKEIRERLAKYISEHYSKFEAELNKLQGKEFVDRITSLLEYTTPKLNRTDLSNDDGSLKLDITPMKFVKTGNAESE